MLKEFEEINKSIWNLEKKRRDVTERRMNRSLFVEMVQDRAFKMDYRNHTILLILLKHPRINLNRMVLDYLQTETIKIPHEESSINSDAIRLRFSRRIKELKYINYITPLYDKAQKIGKIRNKTNIPYELSLAGIFYLLINRSAFSSGYIWHHLMANYSDNKLFQYFLYPYFEQETLKELDRLHPLFIIYLENICNFLKDQMQWANEDNELENSNIEYYLFSLMKHRNKITTLVFQDNDQWIYLRRFLNEKYNWKWIYDANIYWDNSNNRVIIRNLNYDYEAILRVNQTIRKATLQYNGKYYHDFSVKNSTDSLGIFGLTESLKQIRDNALKNGLLRIMALFLLNFNLEYHDHDVMDSSSMNKILSQDKKFAKLIKEITDILHRRVKT